MATSKTVAKKELSTNNYIAGVIAISLLTLLVCGFIGKSLLHSLVINGRLIQGKTEARKQLDVKIAAIEPLINSYHQLGSKQRLIMDGMPNTPDFPQLISVVQAISSKSGVQLKGVTPASEDAPVGSAPSAAAGTTAATGSGTATSPTNEPIPYNFTANINGPYDQIVAFFKNLELSDRPLKVTQAQFTGASGAISAEISLQTYYQNKADISDKTEPVK